MHLESGDTVCEVAAIVSGTYPTVLSQFTITTTITNTITNTITHTITIVTIEQRSRRKPIRSYCIAMRVWSVGTIEEWKLS